MNKIDIYKIPKEIPRKEDFCVRVRAGGQEWQQIDTCLARIDMHNIREASFAYFDFEGTAECEVTSLKEEIHSAEIRPAAAGVQFEREGNTIRFFLNQPAKLSVEINGDRFHNLHLFAGTASVKADMEGAVMVLPDKAREFDLEKAVSLAEPVNGRRMLYFAPGLHRLKESFADIPSDTTVIIDGGAVVMGGFLMDHVRNVTITGRGIIYLGHVKKETYLRGADIRYSKNITVEGVTIVNPAHYSVHLGSSKNIQIRDIKAFSCEGWSDGIDMMACENVQIEDVFMRNSDDCIAIYGMRGEYAGNTRNVTVRRAVLWADVAHPTMIGVHGDAEHGGSIIENISFEDIDILEHHEPQDDYLGCMAINVGDNNIVRNVSYKDIRVEQFERGKLLDIQVKWNKKYNPAPGKCVENVVFENIFYDGQGEYISEIRGFAEERKVKGVRFKNINVRGIKVLKPEDGNIHVGEYAEDISFEA